MAVIGRDAAGSGGGGAWAACAHAASRPASPSPPQHHQPHLHVCPHSAQCMHTRAGLQPTAPPAAPPPQVVLSSQWRHMASLQMLPPSLLALGLGTSQLVADCLGPRGGQGYTVERITRCAVQQPVQMRLRVRRSTPAPPLLLPLLPCCAGSWCTLWRCWC